ncbi:MAG: extracellular solute-binding protein [Spirochaetes bacterium]|nr:extracellular solute-binding protein [Spirochaetota bacterium]
MPVLKDLLSGVRNYFGVIIIVAAFIVSAILVYMNTSNAGEEVYVVQQGDTLERIASMYQTTVRKICEANYPDVQERDKPDVGMKIRLPHDAKNRIVTVRVAHWSLEPGARDGLNYMAKEYRKLHPNIRIVQEAIPESTYGQWFTTQMVGGTPADLMRDGMVAYNLLISYYVRYFTPLTEYVMNPNPYNRINEFSNTSLRDTMKDGLRSCYIPELQEYMAIGLTLHITRMFYNKTLLRQATGSTEPPKDFAQFMAVCEKIKQYKYFDTKTKGLITGHSNAIASLAAARNGYAAKGDTVRAADAAAKIEEHTRAIDATVQKLNNLVPIANSKYHMNMVEGNLFNVVTSKARNEIDYDHDCIVNVVEQYAGMKSGAITMDYAPYRAKFEIVSNYCRQSVPGFSGLNRDDAAMYFVQQRSVFMPTGTWDAGMLERQAADNGFEVGVMDFPYPSKDSPELFKHFEGPAYEDPTSSFRFACASPENAPERRTAAIDFLLFMAAKDNNIKLNDMIGWNPNIVGGVPAVGILKGFSPHVDGVVPGMNFQIGGESIIKWQQMYALFWVGQISYDKLRDEFTPFYLSRGYQDYLTVSKNWRRSLAMDEKLSSILRVKSFVTTDASKKAEYLEKYRYALLRPLNREMTVAYEQRLMRSASQDVKMPPAYQYSAEALRRIQGK